MGTKCTTGHYSESQGLFCIHFGKDSIPFSDCLFQCFKCSFLYLTIHTFLHPELTTMTLDAFHVCSMGFDTTCRGKPYVVKIVMGHCDGTTLILVKLSTEPLKIRVFCIV